ncbi:hypothetical protein EI546_14575 [Aequorivita sp. H23M31]|uniref:Omp28-related outer membrane protein n=1 Tax=Aequorivita ciconiae TaxID=2494375 RepID=A0A410G6G1_9FLAO|nr:Omp28-related outer membrane protein [Aequorivita sp. H23M31]QAA82867.1 hypothetical protein EI546_14575 [Aequorivita sp. H23M31]
MKKLSFQFLTLFVFLAMISCSKKEDPLVEPDAPLTLTLKSDTGTEDFQVLGINTTATFTVIGSDGVDHTAQSQFYVNNEVIPGPTYEFNETGEFSVLAKFNDVTSNTIKFEILEPTDRVLAIDVPKALRNQTITFTLLNDQGEDTSAEATFYVNDEPISGNTFSSPTPGAFNVKATYEANDETFTTPAKEFSVFIPKRKVVIEDYTGTWCGFCPGVALAIDRVKEVTEDVAIVAIHKTSFSLPDPLDFARIRELQDMFNVSDGFPKAQINRTVAWPEPYTIGAVTSMAGNNTDVSIGIKSQLTGSNLTVNVKVVYENGSTPGDKLVVYLLENGVVSPQANYFNETPGHPYQGLGNPIEDYVHNDALRNSLSNLFGDPIPNLPAFEMYTKDYSFSVPSNYVGENLSFVVMVVNENNSAKNAQFSGINEDKNYE